MSNFAAKAANLTQALSADRLRAIQGVALAAAIAGRLECGTAWVNTHLALAPHQPFGGAKWSGIGVENGPWGLYGFTELQVLYRSKT